MIIRASVDPDLFEHATRLFAGAATGAADFLRSPGTIAFVAVEEQDVQGWCWGYALARPDGTRMLYLHHLEVAERCRRRGVGRELLRSFMRAGVQLGATRMFLTTGEHNTAARRLYESMGAAPATQGPTVNYWFVLPTTTERGRRG